MKAPDLRACTVGKRIQLAFDVGLMQWCEEEVLVLGSVSLGFWLNMCGGDQFAFAAK